MLCHTFGTHVLWRLGTTLCLDVESWEWWRAFIKKPSSQTKLNLKKSDTVIHFIDPSSKLLLKEIAHNCNVYFETVRTPIDSFKFKYHDHNYEQCRLIDIHNEKNIPELTYELSKNNYLIDVICVAIHYSNRFTNSDHYINNFCDNNHIINRVLYLKNNSPDKIVEQFIENKEHMLEK